MRVAGGVEQIERVDVTTPKWLSLEAFRFRISCLTLNLNWRQWIYDLLSCNVRFWFEDRWHCRYCIAEYYKWRRSRAEFRRSMRYTAFSRRVCPFTACRPTRSAWTTNNWSNGWESTSLSTSSWRITFINLSSSSGSLFVSYWFFLFDLRYDVCCRYSLFNRVFWMQRQYLANLIIVEFSEESEIRRICVPLDWRLTQIGRLLMCVL